jgi:drug/metabolite transporter (DMT)-like permease
MAVCKQKMEKFMPHLSQVAIQVAFAGMNILNKVALEHGMNNFVFVTYRQIIATLAIAPLAYYFERNQRPALTLSIFCQIFLLALGGITIGQNFFLAGLYYTNPTFASAIMNLIPPVTFVMATILRWENVDIRSMRGQAKVLGIIISVGGAMVMTLYRGPEIKMLNDNLKTYKSNENNRILGSILLFGAVITWSAWIVFQAPVVKKYPAQLSLTAIMCMLGAVQTGVIALICEHKTTSVWVIGWNIKLLTYVYSGVICSAFAIFVQAWCIHIKGPVFVAVFDPLCIVIVAILQYFVLRQDLHTGCMVGAMLILAGLYLVLWGKAEDNKKQEGKIMDSISEATYSNENIFEDGDDLDITSDILKPLLQNASNIHPVTQQ